MCLGVSRSTYHAQVHRRVAHARGSSVARRPNLARAARLRLGSAGSRYDRPSMRSKIYVQHRWEYPCSGSGARMTSLQRHGSTSAGVSVRAAKIDRLAGPQRALAPAHGSMCTSRGIQSWRLRPRCRSARICREVTWVTQFGSAAESGPGECPPNPASASARGAVEIIFYICVVFCRAEDNTTRTPAKRLPRFLHPVPRSTMLRFFSIGFCTLLSRMKNV